MSAARKRRRRLRRARACALLLIAVVGGVLGGAELTAGAAPTAPAGPARTVRFPLPQMGWNTYNTFGCGIDETLVRASADPLIASGMRAAGYTTVSIDDCWMHGRTADGTLAADPRRFRASANFVFNQSIIGEKRSRSVTSSNSTRRKSIEQMP